MARIAIIDRKCTGCGDCATVCPFSAIELKEGKADINSGCRVCGMCLKACSQNAIIRLETKTKSVDKVLWKDILVFCEQTEGGLHPVSLELVGKARELAKVCGWKVNALLIGHGCEKSLEALKYYGLNDIHVFDDIELSYYRAEAYAACAEEVIKSIRPSVVLVGATALGRSLAPRLSTRFHTGLTADCTRLELRENSDLVQIRPAFGGNIMAQIITPNNRPQFATVRYKVMDTPEREGSESGRIIPHGLPQRVFDCKVRLTKRRHVEKTANISDAEILVVGGRGLKSENDLNYVKELARLLNGEYAVSRPLVEKGWETNARQIGLSGRTVRPKLIITCGVSGAIQFTSCMNAADRIIAINSDPNAPIFSVAHVGIVGDLYQIIPQMIEKLKEEGVQDAF